MAIVSLSLGSSAPPECRGGAVTIGNFDGVHVGHQALLAETVRRARAEGSPAVAVTFSLHPLQLLRPETFEPVLTTLHQRVDLLHGYGADHVAVLQTSPALLQLRAHDFFEQMLVERLKARVVVEGYNFGFGKNREGNVVTLVELGREKGIAVELVAPVEVLGKPVSSSRVRRELQAGNVALAATLLGRPFRIEGRVGGGQKRGQTLGFPTANLENIQTLVPGQGVYAVSVQHAGRTWPGAANIGANPTFGESALKVEVHLIGFAGDLYGQTLAVDFNEKLRETRAFAGVEELKTQLAIDVARAAESNRER